MTRVLDIVVLMMVAIAILIPRPGVQVKPALAADAERRARVAELQTRLLGHPTDAEASLELADIFLDGRRPDWALATLTDPLAANGNDHRLHWRRSLALADHFEGGGAYQSAARALSLCEGGSSRSCGDADRSRLELLVGTLERVKGFDMRKDPNRAKQEIVKALRPTYLPKRPATTDAAQK